MRVLITGAAGFLGRTISELLEDKHDLTLADIAPPAGDGRHWVQLDVSDLESLTKAVEGQDAVVHTVALVRGRETAALEEFVRVMVLGTWNVAEACASKGVGRLINISSVAADGWPSGYGGQRAVGHAPVFAPDDRFYQMSKHLGEAIINAYGIAFGMSAVNLRPGVLAGDGVNGEPTRPTPDAKFWFAHVDVRDVAQAVARCLSPVAPNRGTYNLVAARADALFEWGSAVRDLGWEPEHNWPDA